MSQIQVEHTVHAAQARVWAALADFGGIYRFHPRVERSPLLSEQAQGVGAQRRCEFHDGNQVVERVSAIEQGRSITIDIVEGSMPLARARAKISLEPIDAQRTSVVFDMDYDPKFGWLGKAMDRVMMRAQFKKILGEVLEGLDTHLATGAVIGPDGRAIGAAA